ncbi:glycosyltransferase [Streptomyces sclerotialus]|uniref:glycosyltransferase n=1 Tax=Streptomyces sclerotialus TaxID=1957 RepID=UPI0004CC12B0
MRILFTAQASYSHLAPLVLPAAESARRAGHEVAVATGGAVADHIEKRGLTALRLPNVVGMQEALQQGGVRPPVDLRRFGKVTIELEPEFFARAFVGQLAGPAARDLIDVARDWRPDLILHESTEFGGYLAGERLGIPHGVLDIAPMAPYDHPAVTEELNKHRADLGLDRITDPWHAFRTFRAGVVPEDFYPEANRLPSARHYRVPAPAAEEILDPEIARLPADRPLVLATLGSNATHFPGGGALPLLDAIIEALGDLPVTGVVALGANTDPREWRGARAANVHLTSFVQQELLLRSSDAFLTHAGFNGTREALAAGVPMVAVPLFAEQSRNAARLQEIGVGRRVDAQDATPESLAAAVGEVLADRVCRARARSLQRRSHALPGLDRLVADAVAATAGAN